MRNQSLHLILTVALCFLFRQTYSQELAFKSTNDLFGTSVREITSICYDDDGFVWAAARTCVLRVGADEQRTFELPLETTDVVQFKIAYHKGILAVCTQNGQVFRFNNVLQQFERWFKLGDRLQNDDWVTNLLIDDNGVVWLSTNVGIFCWRNDQLIFVDRLAGGLSYMTQAYGSNYIVASAPYIYKIDVNTGDSEQICNRCNLSVSVARYDTLTNRIWLGTYNDGLWQLSLPDCTLSQVQIDGFPKLIIRDILLPDDHSVWVGIDGAGIWQLDRQATRSLGVLTEDLDNPASLHGNGVHALLKDDEGRVWVGTNSGGLSVLDATPNAVEHLTHQPNNDQSPVSNQVSRILQDEKGNLWLATNMGLSRRDGQTGQWTHYFKERPLNCLSLADDDQGTLYVGTYAQGLHLIDQESGKEVTRPGIDTGLFDHGALTFALFKDSDGDIWMGGVKGGIHCFNSKTQKMRTYETEPAYCIDEWKPGSILLGCMYGLILLDKDTGKEELLLTNRTVYDIAVMGQTIYLCTSGDGLIILDMNTGNSTRLTTQAGLPSNYLSSIVQVDSTLWIGTESGLCSMETTDRKIRTYTSFPQLSNVSFNINAAYVLRDGRVALGTNNGAVLFHPRSLNHTQGQGRIYFSNIIVVGRSVRSMPEFELSVPIDSLKTLLLPYPHNSFMLSVLPLGKSTGGSTFSWKLKGEDTEWSVPGTNRYINYTNLPPGKYRLDIRLYEGSVLAERSLNVVVKPPFWGTIWFRLLTAFVLLGIGAFAFRFYLGRLRQHYAEEKIRFFAQMAHDVRTSLTLIMAPIEELHKESRLSQWGITCLQLATEQIKRLSGTATQLLDFQKIDIGREQPLFANVELISLVSSRISVFESYAHSQNIHITFTATPDVYRVQIDPRMIERVVDNLLSNAIKYSPTGQTVEVTLIGEPHRWTLRVKDNGIGISKTAQRKLFREFYRSDNAVNAQIVGSGIGLLMSKKYVAIHNGSISVMSELDKGSTFEVVVPADRRCAEDKSIVPETLPAAKETENSFEELGNIHAPNMHILIVEDNKDLRLFMAQPLREYFKVDTAANGEEAWQFIKEHQPDLVVSDVVMPLMDGFELCRLIKSNYETSHIPVILLTALSDKSEQLKGLGLGADNYLVKPFDMTLLASRITSIIQNRRTVLEKALSRQRTQERHIMENDINDEFMTRAVECVRANISNEAFGKDEFARSLALSSSLLYKKIKALTNLSVVEFIREIRLNYAMELLQSGRHNVTEVSERCGFNTVAYFSKIFKEHFGKTPTEAMNM